MNALIKFLIAARNLKKLGMSKKQIEDFARREFGEITTLLKKQIDNIFKKKSKPDDKKPEGKVTPFKKEAEGFVGFEDFPTGKKTDLTPSAQDKQDEFIEFVESKTEDAGKIVKDRTEDLMGTKKSEGIMDVADKMSKKADELKKIIDENKVTEESILKDALDAATGFRKSAGSKDKTKPFKTYKMDFQRDNPEYRIAGGSTYAEGNLRTAIRQFLRTEAAEGRLKLSEKDKLRIDQYSPMIEDDPIDVFRRYYGEDALEAADTMADELRLGESFKHYEEIFRREMPDLKVKTEGAGEYDQSILDAERIMKEAAEESKNKKILDEFDPSGRKKNSQGGINVSEDIVTLMDKVMAKRKTDKQESKAKQQKRYRDLIASKKFPELELFFREKLTTDRVNAQAGGAFTAPELQQRANQSYLDYLARQNRPVSNIFQPGGTNYPTVNFASVNLNATSPSSPAAGSGTGGTSGGNNSGVIPGYNNYQPNTGITGGGTGSSGGGSGIIGKGNTGGGTTVINKETEETIDLTPPTSGGSGGSGTSGGATGAEALAAYQEYLRNFSVSGGTPLGFGSFRMGTPYAGQLTFTADDFMTLQGLRDQVANYDQTGKLDLGGYTGPDPRGTSDGYQYDPNNEDISLQDKVDADNRDPNEETLLEKQQKEDMLDSASPDDPTANPNFNVQTNQETVSDLQKSAQGLDISNKEELDNFIGSQSNQTVGTDDQGNKITLGDVFKFVGNTALTLLTGGGNLGVKEIIKTAAINKAKQMAADKIKETIGSTDDDIISGTAGNVQLPFAKGGRAVKMNQGGRVKLFTGTVPGFTQQELENRRRLSQRDFAARQGQAMPMSPSTPLNLNRAPAVNIPATNTPVSAPVNTGRSPALGGPTPVKGQPGGLVPTSGVPISQKRGSEGEAISTLFTGSSMTPASGMSTPSNLKSVSEINNMDPFQFDQYMSSLAPSEAKQVEQMLMNQGPMRIGTGENVGSRIPQEADPMNLIQNVGISQSDFDNMTMEQQDDVLAGIGYLQQYGSSAGTTAMILSERGIDPKQFLRSDGTYDQLALGKAKLKGDIQEAIDDGYLPGTVLTGNESFQELADLDRKAYAAILNSISGPSSISGGGGSSQGMQMMNEQKRQMDELKQQAQAAQGRPGNTMNYEQGGRVGYRFGSRLKTKDPKIKMQVSNKHQQLLNLLKQRQSKQLMKGLKNVIANKRKIQDKSPEQIKKAMDRLAQLKKFYGRA